SFLVARAIALGPAPGPFAYWPISGIMVGVLYRRPMREWPALILAATAAQVLTIYLVRGNLAGGATPVGAVVGFLQAAASAAILRRVHGGPYLLDTPRGLAWFVVVAVAGVPLVVSPVLALVYSTGLRLTYPAAWGPLFAGNSLGVLLFAPLFRCLRSTARGTSPWQARLPEVLLCQGLIAGLALLTFAGPDHWVRFVALPYTLFPLLAWSVLRCGPRWTSLSVAGAAAIAAWCTARGLGPFGGFLPLGLDNRVLGLQAYLAFVAFTGLVLVALTEERLYSLAEMSVRDAIRHSFFESSANVMALTGLDGRFVLLNRAGTELHGAEPGTLAGKRPRDILLPDDAAEVEAHDRRVRERGEALAFEEWLGTGEQRRRLQVSRFPVHDGTGALRYVGMIARDDTLERELATRLTGAERVEMLGQLAAGVAHDLNNLLMLVVGYSRLLEEEPSRTAEESEMLREMSSAGDQAAKLTARLMALGRRRAGPPVAISPDAVLGEMETLLRALARGNVDLETRFRAPGVRVAIDPVSIEQIVLNLVSNARDAIHGEGRITLATESVSRGAESWFRITVTDTGEGMDADTVERIFEPFYTTKGDRGTGIGLYTVSAVVRQAGGTIEVRSTPGAGTTFVIDLPAVEPETNG
ncbi:MAG: MASE1 domain-containing protein, partial [Gemmatimonadetes bacterium]|nr:MASE1 domain-containing protein [Gemmatimonadota bacterium]